MAKANKCDRCGEFYQRERHPKIGVVSILHGSIEHIYDLCNLCIVTLEDFMKNAPVLNNIKEDDEK